MKHIARLILISLIFTMLAIPAGANSIRVYAAKATVRCYSDASWSSTKVATLGYGESVTCIGLEGDWALVKADTGAQAYCRVDDLTTENPNTGNLTAYVVSGGAKAYSRPGRSYKSAELDGGTKLTVVALTPDKDWCRVVKSGIYAYMPASDLTTTKPGTETENTTETRSVTAYIADRTVKIYSSTSKSSTVAIAGYGEKVTCTKVDGRWAAVEYGNVSGWCYASKLTLTNPNTASLTVYPATSGVKVYSRPDTSSTVMCTLSASTSLKCVSATPNGDWLRVTAAGKYGYVQTSAMTTTRPDDIDELIDLALAQLGKPYVYATRGPNTFDCSGLTLYCFREVANITLGRSAQSQGYNDRFTKIESISELKRGDIVCFNTEEDDDDLTDHVGIYLGDGQFVHASSARGEVMISSLSSGYYRRVFSWGRRLIE